MGNLTFADVGRKLYHLFIKSTNEHKYYTTLQGIFNHNEDLGVSRFTLDRYNFENPYENLKVIIRKGELFGKPEPVKKTSPHRNKER